jgi:exosortase
MNRRMRACGLQNVGSADNVAASISIQNLSLFPSAFAMLWLVSRARWFWTHNSELHFGWVVLLLCGYLFREAWRTHPAFRLRWNGSALLLAASGLFILFATQLYQAAFGVTTEGMSALGAGAMLFVAGNFHYVFGWSGVRCFAFPFGFFFLALPVPETVYYPLVAMLQSKVAAMNVELLGLIGIPAEQVGNVIRLPTCVVGIDEACSGIRSLQSAIMATLFIGYLTLKKKRFQFALLGLGILLAFAGNLGRSFFLSYTAYAKGIQAIAAYHDAAGWSILAFTAGGVMLFAWMLSRLEKLEIRGRGGTTRNIDT